MNLPVDVEYHIKFRWLGAKRSLRQQCLHDVRLLHTRQALVETLMLVGEPLVVDAQQMQDSRLEVAYVHRIAHDVIRELVGFPMHYAALDAAAGHP